MEKTRIRFGHAMNDEDVSDGKPSRTSTLNATTKGRSKGAKREERGRRMTGCIARIRHGQGDGFIRAEDDRQLFFHRSDVRIARFNALAVRDPVAFEVIEDKLAGPRAVKVKRAAGNKRGR
jgi:cold shock CspA family protein